MAMLLHPLTPPTLGIMTPGKWGPASAILLPREAFSSNNQAKCAKEDEEPSASQGSCSVSFGLPSFLSGLAPGLGGGVMKGAYIIDDAKHL